MRNFIGNILIGFAVAWSFARTTLLFALTVAIVLGILIITMIGLFELIGKISPNPEYQMVVLGKWYWDVIALVLGGSTMWLGFQKMLESDESEPKKLYINMESIYKTYEVQIDEKPSGVVLRINDENRCVLRICRIPRELVFNSDGKVKDFIDITYPKTKK